jgi:hypothetical protein
MSRTGGDIVVRGSLAAPAARLAGLPANTPALVTVTVDRGARVRRLVVRSATQAGSQGVDVQIVSEYLDFGAVPRIQAPV